MKKKVLISIDPSSTSTGWAVFQFDSKTCELIDSGQWNLSKGNHTLIDRIDSLRDNLHGLCREWCPDVCSYECPDIYTNPKFKGAKTQIAYRKAVDCTKQVLWERLGVKNCFGVTVREWKDTKSKKCTLNEVNYKYNLKLTNKEDDRGDAIGIGDEYLQRLDTEREFTHD